MNYQFVFQVMENLKNLDSINSAINFCKLTSSELTISDNSNDTKKLSLEKISK